MRGPSLWRLKTRGGWRWEQRSIAFQKNVGDFAIVSPVARPTQEVCLYSSGGWRPVRCQFATRTVEEM